MRHPPRATRYPHVRWRLQGALPARLELTLPASGRVTLHALRDTGGGIEVTVEAEMPFTLEIETDFVTYVEQVPAGHTHYLLTYLDRTDVREV